MLLEDDDLVCRRPAGDANRRLERSIGGSLETGCCGIACLEELLKTPDGSAGLLSPILPRGVGSRDPPLEGVPRCW